MSSSAERSPLRLLGSHETKVLGSTYAPLHVFPLPQHSGPLKQRHPGLDAARGLAAIAMVMGHTLDALLSPGARSSVWVQRYWELRGVTAPLFLLVAGWAVVAALGNSPTAARDTFHRRVKRAGLLLFLGYLLHWPGWRTVQALGWSEALLHQVLAFDALQCIAWSLFLGALVLRWGTSLWSRTLFLGVLALGIPLLSPWVWKSSVLLPTLLAQSVGGASTRFPFFPWAGYFFAGALAAHLLRSLSPGLVQGLALVGSGFTLLVISWMTPADWSPASAWLVSYRVAQGLWVLGVINLLPVQLTRLLRPFGTRSLWLYVMHLPLVYGWAGIPGLVSIVGPTMNLGGALLVGGLLLALCQLVIQRVQMGRGPKPFWPRSPRASTFRP